MARSPGPNGVVNVQRVLRMKEMRDRGLSYRAIRQAVEVYEGRAPSEKTIKQILRRLGCPAKPRGNPFTGQGTH